MVIYVTEMKCIHKKRLTRMKDRVAQKLSICSFSRPFEVSF